MHLSTAIDGKALRDLHAKIAPWRTFYSDEEKEKVRTSISVALGGISMRSDPLGRIYGWIPSVHLLGSVTRVPYLVSLYRERNTETLKPTEILLKPLQTP